MATTDLQQELKAANAKIKDLETRVEVMTDNMKVITQSGINLYYQYLELTELCTAAIEKTVASQGGDELEAIADFINYHEEDE